MYLTPPPLPCGALVVAMTVGPLVIATLLLTSYVFVGIQSRKPQKGAKNKNYELPDDMADLFPVDEINALREVLT